jgi:hypothetical protein
MIERHSKVFVPVSVDERLPDKEDRYSVIVDGVQESAYFNGKQFEFAVYMEKYITHWLEEKENVYVLSEQELIALMNSCIHNGMCCTPSNVEEFAKNYIQSKTNPQTTNK